MNHTETNIDFSPVHTTPGITLADRLGRFAEAHPLQFSAWMTATCLATGALIGCLCSFVAWLPVLRTMPTSRTLPYIALAALAAVVVVCVAVIIIIDNREHRRQLQSMRQHLNNDWRNTI